MCIHVLCFKMNGILDATMAVDKFFSLGVLTSTIHIRPGGSKIVLVRLDALRWLLGPFWA